MFKNEETGLVSVGEFLAVCTTYFHFRDIFVKVIKQEIDYIDLFKALRITGLRKNDPRLQELTDNLKKEHTKNSDRTKAISHETQKLDREQFRR